MRRRTLLGIARPWQCVELGKWLGSGPQRCLAVGERLQCRAGGRTVGGCRLFWGIAWALARARLRKTRNRIALRVAVVSHSPSNFRRAAKARRCRDIAHLPVRAQAAHHEFW